MKPVDYYQVLGVPATARDHEIRQAYRQLCREYHPDTTTLSQAEALEKFLVLNEAYTTLNHPVKRTRYDQARIARAIELTRVPTPVPSPRPTTFDIQERALSSTELFALFILGFAFLASLLLVGFVSLTKGY
ncbi:J domain-containing protein [Candidatus Cyanaurora vandensis]|uniref:J domain-containing protein n=1 Tax=Candidatus Cyanaurora vandensis TaxID=2714958 RepID=UPI00257DB282|nr:J domain-containing protein [Candidatus Cyanaurora vandensis]